MRLLVGLKVLKTGENSAADRARIFRSFADLQIAWHGCLGMILGIVVNEVVRPIIANVTQAAVEDFSIWWNWDCSATVGSIKLA
jgi:hypothetical protein